MESGDWKERLQCEDFPSVSVRGRKLPAPTGELSARGGDKGGDTRTAPGEDSSLSRPPTLTEQKEEEKQLRKFIILTVKGKGRLRDSERKW